MKILYFVHDEMTYIAQAIEKYNNTDIDFYYLLTDFRYYDLIDKEKCLRIFENFDIYDYKKNPIELPQEVLNGIYANLMRDKTDTSGMQKEKKEYQLNHAFSLTKKLYLYIKNLNPDYILFQGAEGYYTYIIQDIAKSLNITTLVFSGFRNFDRFGFYLSFEQKKAKHFYKDNLSNESLEFATNFLENFRKGENKYFNTLLQYRDDKVIRPLLKRLKDNIIYLFKEETKFYVENINLWEKIIYKFWTRGIKEKIMQNILPLYYEKFDYQSEKFVFFPLHITPEVSNMISPFWQDQLRAIDFILYALPSNYKLVIKEHPGMILSRRGLKFYNILKRKPGVVFVDKSINSRKFIEKAEYIIGINSTALLEAYFLGKKAICLGNFMFEDIITKVNSIEELKNIFHNDSIIPDTKEEIIKNIARFYEYSYENVVLDSPNRYSYVISRQNILNLLNIIKDFTRKLDE